MKENKEKVLVFYVKGSGKKPYRVAFLEGGKVEYTIEELKLF